MGLLKIAEDVSELSMTVFNQTHEFGQGSRCHKTTYIVCLIKYAVSSVHDRASAYKLIDIRRNFVLYWSQNQLVRNFSWADLYCAIDDFLLVFCRTGRHTSSDSVSGVMGIDLKIDYLKKTFENLYPQCSGTSEHR